jgi:hypothetical protein
MIVVSESEKGIVSDSRPALELGYGPTVHLTCCQRVALPGERSLHTVHITEMEH